MIPVQLNADQIGVFNKFWEWFKNPYSQIFRIDGCAGTGKTTLISVINEAIINHSDHCRIAAYTGKAVSVLRKKGLNNACTIHHLIYRPFDPDEEKRKELIDKLHETEEPEERLKLHEEIDQLRAVIYNSLNPSAFEPREDDDEPMPQLIIIDESSMLSANMLSDLTSFNIPILLVGDDFQLPPVKAHQHRTDINAVLSRIVRQAEGSPIIQMAKTLRDTGRLESNNHPDACIVDRKPKDWMEEYDQLLCGKNDTRRGLNENARVRLLQAKNPFPMVRDRLICLKNNNDGIFYNGSLWFVTEVEYVAEAKRYLTKLRSVDAEPDTVPIEVVIHRAAFLENPHFSIQTFDYANALTVHKSQGSEWNKVLVLDESRFWSRFNGPDSNENVRWLYTAITRAKERLVVVRDY